MEIMSNQTYEMTNVLSCRKRMNEQEINSTLQRLGQFIKENKLVKGNVAVTTYSIDIQDGTQYFDMEILCPVDRTISPPKDFTMKPLFRLKNALKLSHFGNPNTLQSSQERLISYANEKGYTIITSIYNVTVNEPRSVEEVSKMQVDLYLGITENIL